MFRSNSLPILTLEETTEKTIRKKFQLSKFIFFRSLMVTTKSKMEIKKPQNFGFATDQII